MHYQYDVSCGESCKALAHPCDLFGKTLPARRAAVRGRAPERMIGVTRFTREIVVAASGPFAKILLAKIWFRDRPQTQGRRRRQRTNTETGEGRGVVRQFCAQGC